MCVRICVCACVRMCNLLDKFGYLVVLPPGIFRGKLRGKPLFQYMLVDGSKCITRRTEVNERADGGDCLGGRIERPMAIGEYAPTLAGIDEHVNVKKYKKKARVGFS